MADTETTGGPGDPTLWSLTVELGRLLRDISDADPEGHPTETAAGAFRHWLTEAEPASTDTRYFVDIAENYDIEGRSNRDLFDIFELLHPYLELEAPEDLDVSPARTFINLPMTGL